MPGRSLSIILFLDLIIVSMQEFKTAVIIKNHLLVAFEKNGKSFLNVFMNCLEFYIQHCQYEAFMVIKSQHLS